jgi:hypothetical protein
MANKLVLELFADSNGLIKGLNDAQRSVDRFQQSSSAVGRSLGGGVNQALEAFTGLAKGGAAAAGVLAGATVAAATAAVALTLSTGKQIEAMDQLSQKTGIAVQSIQRMSVVMAENNFDAQTLTSGMRTLSKLITDARNPASNAAETFAEMGIAIQHLGSTEDVIRAVANQFASMPDGVDKARLAVTLFGKSGLEMIPVLNRGAAAFDASAKASERFGVVLSTQQVAALQAADDASDRLGVALQGLQHQLSATFAPAVTTGINAVTEGVAALTRITQNYGAALKEIQKEHPIISSLSPGMASAMATARAAQMPAPSPGGIGPSGPMNSHIADFVTAQGLKQEEIGLALRRKHIAAYQQQLALGHAQESLGHVLGEIEQSRAQRQLRAEEALIAMHGDLQKGLDAQTQAYIDMANAADAALVAETAVEVEADKRNQVYQGEFMRTQHIAAAGMKTVWQQQLQSIVDSNTFSVGMIVSGWTSGLANAIVNFQNFGQTMTQIGKQTAASLLQSLLNFGVQRMAQWALQDATILAGNAATAGTTVAIWEGAGAAIVGTFGAITGAIQGFFTSVLIPAFISIGEAIMTFLSAIAEAAADTIFGIPYALAILAGVAVIGAAIGTLAAFAFKDGGIATGPTMGLIGEAGSSEAVIPLNKRGAAFMRETLGIGGGGGSKQPIHTHIYLDKREFAMAISDSIMPALRGKGLPA